MLLNKKMVREFALCCADRRAHNFERVGKEFYERMNYALMNMIRKDIESLPSVGKTIK